MARLPLTDSLVIATHNMGKLDEFRELLADFPLRVCSAGELNLPEPEETGTSFRENAEIKALAAAREANLPALADDSGLMVDCLDGKPGIYSARWAGADKNFAHAMERIHNEMLAQGAVADNRGGQFVCALCLAFPDGECLHFYGEISGEIIWPPRGNKGFGYDPFFLPDGMDKTFGELDSWQKHGWTRDMINPLSHRARAFAAFARVCLTDM